MNDFIGFVLFLVMSMGSLMIGFYKLNETACEEYSEITGLETKYKTFAGCFVKVGDRYHYYKDLKIEEKGK